MSERNFKEMLEEKWRQKNFVCVGFDVDKSKIPHALNRDTPRYMISRFCNAIVDATKKSVCAFKPNLAFFERYGPDGILALRDIIAHIKDFAPDVLVILDAKRADIGTSNIGSVEMAFDYFGADAITVNPYFGAEALEPFFARKDKGIIVLCRTSNSGAKEIQDLKVDISGYDAHIINNRLERSIDEGVRLYQYIAYRAALQWNKNDNCCLVVGATVPPELKLVRQIVGDDMPILIPGIGAQGGEHEETVQAGKNSKGTGIILNSSRKTIYASNGPDFAEAAGCDAARLNDATNQFLKGGAL